MKIKLIDAHKSFESSDEIIKELASIQNYVDSFIDPLQSGNIYYIPLKAFYRKLKGSTILAGIFVNMMKCPIIGMRGTLITSLNGTKLKDMSFEFPYEFLGILNPDEGFPIHIEIPTQGLCEDVEFQSSDINCELINIEVLKLENDNADN